MELFTQRNDYPHKRVPTCVDKGKVVDVTNYQVGSRNNEVYVLQLSNTSILQRVGIIKMIQNWESARSFKGPPLLY